MQFSDIDLATTDLDWFAVDQSDQIGHFATGGIGWVPESVRSSKEDNALLSNFFNTIVQDISDCELIYENVKREVEDNMILNYSDPFLRMAKKGIFSFDVSLRDRSRLDFYFLIAKPTTCINLIQFNENIISILVKTRLKIRFNDVVHVHKADMNKP